MERNGERMATDPASLRHSSREGSDQLPTAPRRNSTEDEDISRPRKRLATMGSGPQSPQIMDTDEVKSVELQQAIEEGQISYSPNSMKERGDGISISKLGKKGTPGNTQTSQTLAEETRSSSENSLEELDLTAKMVEPSDPSRSPVAWQEEVHFERKSPELVQQADDLEDLDQLHDGAVDVDLIVDEPVLDEDPKKTQAIMENVIEKLSMEDNPIGVLDEFQRQVTAFLSGANDEIESYQRTIQKNKALWDWLPVIVESFLKRAKPFSMLFYRVNPSTGMTGSEVSLDFLSNFARLTSKMVQKDFAILRRFPNQEQIELISVAYVNTVMLMLRPDTQLFTLFRNDRGSPFLRERMNIALHFCNQTGGITAFREIVETLLERVPKQPNLFQPLLIYFQTTQLCLSLCHRLNIMEWDAEENSVDINPLKHILADATALFLSFERSFRTLIESHLSSVTSKEITWAFEVTGEFARDLGFENFKEVVTGLGVQHAPPELTAAEEPCFAEWCWKFPLCLAFINTSKLDLRIYGIQKLQDGILRMYREVVDRLGGNDSSLLKYVATSLQSKKVVEYLVGAGSHPELTRRCSSILQFLVVTNQLTPEIREALWRPLVENKDSRTVSASMSLINDSAAHGWPLELCVDYCRRASAVPITNFEPAMPGFIRKLVEVTLQACDNDPDQKALPEATNSSTVIHVAVYDMLIAFLKSAAIAQEDSAVVKIPPSWVMSQLRDDFYRISQYGPSAVEQHQICKDCLQDIRSKSKTATASIMVIVAFLRQKVEQMLQPNSEMTAEVKELFLDLQLHVAVVEELRFFVDEHQGLHTDYVTDALRIRMDLIEIIIYIYPEGLTSDLSYSLWDCLMGFHALGPKEREVAFNELANLAQNTIMVPEKNLKMKPFFETLFTDFFPQLHSEQFSQPALHFCCRALEYINENPELNSDGVIEPKGIDQIWRIILSAPPHLERISHEAIAYMVKYYFDSLANQDNRVLQDTHFALVTSCISHLKSTTSTLENSQASVNVGEEMAIDLTEEDRTRTHLEFQRSVELLSALIKGYRIRPHCTNPLPSIDRGDPVKVRCQIMGNGRPNSVFTLDCWNNESTGTLAERITRISNATNYRVIHNGRELHLMQEPARQLKDLRLAEMVNFIIMIRPDPQGGLAAPPTNTALELEVLKHFDEFYGLLVLPEPYSAMIWKLLREFPIQKQVSDIFETESIEREKWPTGHPWQVQYFIAAMKNRIQQLKTHDDIGIKGNFYREAIVLLLSGLTDVAISGPGSTQGLRAELTLDYLQTLFDLLKEQTVYLDISQELDKPDEAIKSLLLILKEALDYQFAEDNSILAKLTVTAFGLLFLLTDKCQLWDQLVAVDILPMVIGTAILVHQTPLIRQNSSETILSFCRNVQDSTLSEARTVYFWNILQHRIFPKSEAYADRALEFVKLARELFKYLALKYPESIDVPGYFNGWASAIMNYQIPEPLSTVNEDYLFTGYVQLTHQCLKLAADVGQELDSANLVYTVFWKFLFTSYSDENEITGTAEKFPVISPLARNELYKLVLFAVHNGGYGDLLDYLLHLFPTDDYLAEGWNLDRSRWLVSSAGYLGMKNLANTCYLNSLMTQLFMNTQFRKFIFDVEVEDFEKQNLLVALKGLFGEMQGGKSKFVDPSALAAAIRDHEDNEIDVTVQMDVDEFFNLLFDRLEGQMPSKEVKDKFRALYGGNLVQQVKSKECTHISEREEPFSAIQCDIKGKANLAESLQAYVEGDVMEGDNKYSCSQCNRHVDAVKRACLKDIPDHLIFHLKRFDFDLETMQRRKINDRFEFPEAIDMRPYTVQYLSDPEAPTAPDVFELVGVLVHTGSAESGHYYSYMKDQDADNDYYGRQQWLQFNDSEVSEFDYNTLGDCCFGGTNDMGGMNNHALGPKPYSAYMLFYKRVNSPGTVSMSRKSLENIPEDLKTRILQDNETKVRRYCMFDNDFISFVLQVSQRAHDAHEDSDHSTAAKATTLMLQTICNITARIKDCVPGDALVERLRGIIANCVPCSRVILDWACQDEFNIRLMVIKCPLMKVRGTFTDLVFDALQCLSSNKECYLDLYGVSEEPQNCQEHAEFFDAPGYIQKLFDIMARSSKLLQSTVRPWDDYFGILLQILTAGPQAVALFLHRNLLYRCLDLFYGEYHLRGNASQFRIPERNRKPSYVNLLRILALVMEYLDLSKCYDSDDDDWNRAPMLVDDQLRFAVTPEEKKAILKRDKNGDTWVYQFLYKQLEANGIEIDSTRRIITNWLIRYRNPEVRRRIRDTLLGGVSLDPASEAGPFLDCLVIFISLSESSADVAEIIERVAADVATIQNSGGREHFEFFRSLRYMESDYLPGSVISDKVVETVPQWAPALLTYCDPEVRHDTYSLIDECLFLERENATSEEETLRLDRIVDQLCLECFNFVEHRYLKQKELSQNADPRALDEVVRVFRKCKDSDAHPDNERRIQDMQSKLAKILEEEVEYASDGTDDNWNVSDFSIPDDESV